MAKAPEKTRKAGKRPPLPTIETEIKRLDDEGMGIGGHERKDVLVPQALPGERVVATVEHEGREHIVGRLCKVLTKSPDRVCSPCTQASECLGCSLIQMNYHAQLRFKEDRVRRALRRYETLAGAKLHPIWEAPQPLGYRTNAKLVMGKKRGRVKIGLYRRGTHEVVDIGDCPLHHPLINRIIHVVREEVERQGIFVYDPMKRRGLLRYLAVRISPAFNKAMVTFVTAERNYREITHLAKWLKKKVPEVISIQQNVNPSEGKVIFGRETLKMLGTPDLIDLVGDIRLRIAPTSFFQVNNDQAARIYKLVRRWANLTREENAVDLYCGIGGIALHLAGEAGKVVGIDVADEAVKNARENARMNNLKGCTFRSGDAAELVQDLFMEIAPANVAVANPPRRGCDQKVLQALAELAPRTLIYVSCDPETLARDLDRLHFLRYRTLEVQPVDMFPQTSHVESVARLAPAGSGGQKQRTRHPQKQQDHA